MITFLWHDYETFGLSPSLDRPAQFAAIRTDENLNVIDKPICWYCKPSMDTMPDPQSIGITGILPQYCEEHGLIEAKFARAIHKEMIREETISVGYNSMRFDDEVSRFTFWRNFISPYDREFDNGCSRFDLFPLVVATWALRPDGINWPKAEGEDRPTFRLEKLFSETEKGEMVSARNGNAGHRRNVVFIDLQPDRAFPCKESLSFSGKNTCIQSRAGSRNQTGSRRIPELIFHKPD